MVDHQTHQKLWRRSDSLVKGWILGSLSKETLVYIVNRLTGKLHQDDFSAKDVWDELQTMYAPAVVPKLHVVEGTIQLLFANRSFVWVGDLDKDTTTYTVKYVYSTCLNKIQSIQNG